MKDNDVWDLVDLPPNSKTVGRKWLFKKKTDTDGAIHTFKARLVAKGFTQTYEVDYEETYSLVADIIAIRILIAIAAFYDYEIWQMNVKTAFLNGHFSEEVYMVQPEGEAAYILGIKIYRDRSKRLIGLCQSAYIEKILKRYFMENSKCGTIPMQKKLKLSKSQGTRLDVAFAQNIISRFQQNLGELHWNTVKNILKYLRNTKDMFLVYGSEYIAAYDASKEVVWIRKFIYGLGIVPTIEEPIKMYCDNTRAIVIAKESGIIKGARHYRVKVHYLREVIEYGDVKIEKVHTDGNLADPFTKAYPKHSELTKNIGLIPASSLM
ncbi:retrotransposon protein, putative, ty1-copia subclass [Tanacetum coccineum]